MLKINAIESITRKITPLLRIQCLSTATQSHPEERIQSFRTKESSPLNHVKDHIGRFYMVKPEVQKQLFSHGGLPKQYTIQAKTFTETCLMIREPSISVMSCLKAIDFEKPVVRFVLYGKKGNGKSLSLAHLIHYAFEAGFLLVHVPWVGEWMRRCKESSNSETKEGYTDINLQAAAWLVHFKTQNAHILNNPELKTSKDYVWSKREQTTQNSPILELIDHGINRIKYASDTVVALADEIKTFSNKGLIKTFVALDGFNGFFYPETRIYTEKKEIVHPFKVTITQAFLNLSKFDWKNGVVVVTVDEIANGPDGQLSHWPRYLLGQEGFEHLDPFVPINVPEYTFTELSSCLDYYRERKWIRANKDQDKELAFLSACNPYNLMQLTAPL